MRAHQRRDVLSPGPQGRDVDGDHGEAEVEILAELAGAHLALEITARRRDDAHVGRERLVAADAAELPRLEHPQQRGLHVEGELADLVEEDRAAARGLERALAQGDRAREGAAFVTEELTLDEGVRDRSAVDDDEGLRTAAAPHDRARQHLLARSGLALQEHRRVRPGHAVEDPEDPAHGDPLSDDAVEVVAGVRLDVQQRQAGTERQLHVDR